MKLNTDVESTIVPFLINAESQDETETACDFRWGGGRQDKGQNRMDVEKGLRWHQQISVSDWEVLNE